MSHRGECTSYPPLPFPPFPSLPVPCNSAQAMAIAADKSKISCEENESPAKLLGLNYYDCHMEKNEEDVIKLGIKSTNHANKDNVCGVRNADPPPPLWRIHVGYGGLFR